MKKFVDDLVRLLTCHWLTMAGTAVTTASAALFASLMLGRLDNPYVGILLFLVLPALFALGLILIPAGIYRKSREVGGIAAILTPVTAERRATVRLAILVVAATGVNMALVSTTTVQGIDYMESAAFCGQVCHVMEPQYAAHQSGPHAEVACVECHVAGGASSFVYHKIDGLRQVASLVTNSYERPIPASGGRLHAAEETCGTCHRMDAAGDVENLRIIRTYTEEEASAPQTTVLLLHTERIHESHASGRIRYAAEDDSLQTIPWLSVDGTVYAYGEPPETEERVMDCIDCHNRVGHQFATAEDAVDAAIRNGEIDPEMPFAKRDALEELTADAPSEITGTLQEIRDRNVFPEMQVSWETYPNNIGHTASPGCFRCHTNDHVNDAGEAVGQGCLSCHSLLAVASPNPAILDTLGVAR